MNRRRRTSQGLSSATPLVALFAWLVVSVLLLTSCEEMPFASDRQGGQLVLRQRTVGDTFYVEGSIWFARLDAGDTVIAETKVDGNNFSIKLPPGFYRLTSYQRACSGNCGALDPPTDRCSAPLRIRPGKTLRALVFVRPGFGCEVKLQ